MRAALQALGYRVAGPFGVQDPDIAKNALPQAKLLLDQFDAFQDNPWAILYKDLDKLCPNSKFIATYRDSSKWYDSQVKHFGGNSSYMREWIYGVGDPKGNREIYIKRYKKHYREIASYFKHRRKDIITMKLEDGDGWKKLCNFLNCDVPQIDFPHMNKAVDRK